MNFQLSDSVFFKLFESVATIEEQETAVLVLILSSVETLTRRSKNWLPMTFSSPSHMHRNCLKTPSPGASGIFWKLPMQFSHASYQHEQI